MPTIHITIDDHAEAFSALAAFLNLDIAFDIRIDLDEMTDDATAEDIDQIAYAVGNGIDVGRQKFLDDKLRGLAYALESGDQIAGTVVGSVHYDGPTDGTGTYTILFTNGNGWYGRGDQIVTAPDVDQAQRRQAAYDARRAEVDAALTVKCSYCKAHVGNPCRTPDGKNYGAFAHIARIAASKKVK